GFAVNNNAGALLLALASVAGSGGRVAVSRGELIEIGGSFRLPDLMSASGAELVEIGTTNRTRAADYAAVAGHVDALLKVHPSNYRIDGFQEEATYRELTQIANEHEIPFVADVGSGLMDDTAPWLGAGDKSWLANEPGVIQTVEAGADLVLFSGDKLLGGPQCGVLVGKTAAIDNARKHPIARAVRLDGPTIAAVSDTFEMYADNAVKDIPFWAMASASIGQIEERAAAVLAGLSVPHDIVDGESVPGAGSVPGATIATKLIAIPGNADATWQILAGAELAVIATRRDDSVFIDMRSVLPDQDDAVRRALKGLES
ncbi:MAG: L-seryl-tRNA(Sec) selenium transferase, partial [Acidimicrobiia bacterium]